MSKTFKEGDSTTKSEIKKSSVSLYSCEAESAVSTIGECVVLLEHRGSNCVSSVIVAKNLAHECLLGMNVLTKWPVTKDAIEVLLTASGNKANDKYKCLDTNVKAVRLHNICIPEILREDFIETTYEFKAIKEGSNDYNAIYSTAN